MLTAWLTLHLGSSSAATPQRPNIVLVSLDTTRADALSCYGIPPGPYRTEQITTPNIDALAAEGIRFQYFFTHAPSTLSSHASLLTGTDPHGHAVPRNGFPLNGAHATLTERLTEAGWESLAVVGSSALEAAMGLDRGFRVYNDTLTEPTGPAFQARADDVVRRVFAEIDARTSPEAPLFLMAHFYDPHAPYDPPEPFRTRYTDPDYAGNVSTTDSSFRVFASQVRRQQADPADIAHVSNLYRAEVAFVDAQIGVLLDGLGERGLLERAIVVVVADHGETLADDALYAWSHGSNIAYEVMRIPLVVRGYGFPLAERAVIARQAATSGLAPTLLELLGLPSVGDGLSFADSLRPGPVFDADGWPERPTIPVYLEATRPRYAENAGGWNNLYMHRGVWAGGWGVVAAPFLLHSYRFYAEGAPPDEQIRTLLERLVRRWDRAAPRHVTAPDAPKTTEALRALGYVE